MPDQPSPRRASRANLRDLIRRRRSRLARHGIWHLNYSSRRGAMKTSRLEAFSDAVLAIIITIMVLDLRVPEGSDLPSLRHTTGTAFLTYLLSFIYVAIYWNNHHHMFQLVREITGGVLWANLSLLFCLSLFPFT